MFEKHPAYIRETPTLSVLIFVFECVFLNREIESRRKKPPTLKNFILE